MPLVAEGSFSRLQSAKDKSDLFDGEFGASEAEAREKPTTIVSAVPELV